MATFRSKRHIEKSANIQHRVNMKKKFLILAVILVTFCSIVLIWWQQAMKPYDPTNQTPISFTIQRGETTRIIAEKLQKQNLLRSSVAFFLLARFGGYGDRIQSGDFLISPSMDLVTLISSLTHGTVDTRITIPEGWRNEEIAIKLTKEFGIPEQEFLKVAQEGYMFPDTYLVPKEASASQIASLMKKTFDTKVHSSIFEKGKSKGLTKDQIVIIASLVEREAKSNEDRPIIASVILNRFRIGMKLDIDATIQYALGYQSKEKTWWKKELTLEDVEVESPYNTYNNPGLPPTPICNPGLAVFQAVVNAPETDYLYYISDLSGKVHPAKTIEEHNTNIAKYLNK
jgi:UPF0755 protein